MFNYSEKMFIYDIEKLFIVCYRFFRKKIMLMMEFWNWWFLRFFFIVI